ncbi:MAG TPA: rod shape-determining protein MreC [Rhizomicrobium sp.]|jgi:rod shape-determining protein MreC|nr:rod shape-determining protein MreC [Rhizomicrobium sp.]
MTNAWKIARKGNAQLPLVIVIALAVVLVLLGKAQGGLFDRARGHVTDMMAPVLEKLRAPVAGFDRWMGSVTEIFSVYEENLKLKEENARLRQWRNVAVVLQGRVGHYQQLLHAVPDPRMNAVLARVIGRANRPFLQTMILDAGREAHALPGEAVMDPRGMIGRIYLTGNRTSWVILLTDLNSRIPVTISPGNIQAIMAGDNSPMPGLDMVSHTVILHAGDQVTSSGDGGFLPAGLAIGTVVSDGQGGFRVALLSDAAASQDVEILNFSKPPETPPANAQLPVEAAGLKPEAPPPAPVAPAATPQPQPTPVKPKPVLAAPPPETAATAAPGETEDVDR